MESLKTIKGTVLKVLRVWKSKAILTAYSIYITSVMKRYIKGLESSLKIVDDKILTEVIDLVTPMKDIIEKNANIISTNLQNKDNQEAILDIILHGVDREEIDSIISKTKEFATSPRIKTELKKHKSIWESVVDGITKDAGKFVKIITKVLPK